MKIVAAVVSIALALLFLYAGGSKLFDPVMHVTAFREWGYPHWSIYVVGLIEVSGALLLLAPFARFPYKLRGYGALLLAIAMLAATATQLKAHQEDQAPLPLVLCILCLFVAYVARPQLASTDQR